MEFSVATSYAKNCKVCVRCKASCCRENSIDLIDEMVAGIGWPVWLLGGALSPPCILGLRLAKLYSPS